MGAHTLNWVCGLLPSCTNSNRKISSTPYLVAASDIPDFLLEFLILQPAKSLLNALSDSRSISFSPYGFYQGRIQADTTNAQASVKKICLNYFWSASSK